MNLPPAASPPALLRRAVTDRLGRTSPRRLWRWARGLGLAWMLAAPDRRQLAETHLEAAFPYMERLIVKRMIRRMFHHLAALPLEVLAAGEPQVRGSVVEMGGAGRMAISRRSYLEDVLAAGRGALVLTGHLGNFELALYAEAARGVPLAVVTKRIAQPGIDSVWREMRRDRGIQLIEDDNSLRAIFGALRRGRAVVMTLDQHANRMHAVRARFFGRPAWTHRGMALISARADVPVVPAFALRKAPGYHVLRYGEPIAFERGRRSVREALRHHTQRYTSRIEAAVCAHPEQWTWLHRRWKDLSGE